MALCPLTSEFVEHLTPNTAKRGCKGVFKSSLGKDNRFRIAIAQRFHHFSLHLFSYLFTPFISTSQENYDSR